MCVRDPACIRWVLHALDCLACIKGQEGGMQVQAGGMLGQLSCPGRSEACGFTRLG